MNRIKKTVVCLALCMVMLLGSSLTSFAASGSTYSYANLNLTWSTSASGASASLRSGTYAHLAVSVSGDAYKSGVKKAHFGASKVADGLAVGCSASRPSGTTIKNGYAEGNRNWNTQYLYASIYY